MASFFVSHRQPRCLHLSFALTEFRNCTINPAPAAPVLSAAKPLLLPMCQGQGQGPGKGLTDPRPTMPLVVRGAWCVVRCFGAAHGGA